MPVTAGKSNPCSVRKYYLNKNYKFGKKGHSREGVEHQLQNDMAKAQIGKFLSLEGNFDESAERLTPEFSYDGGILQKVP